MSPWMRTVATVLVSMVLGRAPLDAQAAAAGTRDWRDGGTCYEIFVRSFYDSDGDGVGDLKGLTQKLDYVNDGDPATTTDLGANCLWLMPIMPSPSYHGYDVTDYYHVNPSYGTNQDFKDLVAAAHRRGIKVLVDMVPNHTSDQHPWFLDALLHPGTSPYRSWYRWSKTRGPRNEWGGYNWHPTTNGDYYYGFFSPSMPDLNWESPAVRAEFNRISDFWLKDMGADGFREDAVRHLMEDSTHWANAPATHDVLREYEAHIRQVAPDAFTIGEVFDSTDVLETYYPDQLDAYFAFQVANAILSAVTGGGAGQMMSAVMDLQGIAPDDRWAPFLRNHDQSRAMTWLKGDMARARLAASLLFTLPGVPFVYYGEEIGMVGDKPDPRIRTPMQWVPGKAAGFTTGMPWEPLQDDSMTANVEVMDQDPGSLLNHYRRLIHLRASDEALGSGKLVPLDAGNDQVAAYLRTSGGQVALVVANLSDTPLEGVALSSNGAVLPRGRYGSTALLGGGTPPPLSVGRDGRIRGYVPISSLAPLRAYVIGLSVD
jgi:alpha-amylase